MAGTLPVISSTMNVAREGPIYNVKIDQAESGIEVRTVWGTTPRYRYKVQVFLRDGSTEYTPAQFVSLLNSNYGSGDSFEMTDPVDSSTVAVRLDGVAEMSQYQGIAGWWVVSFQAVTVID